MAGNPKQKGRKPAPARGLQKEQLGPTARKRIERRKRRTRKLVGELVEEARAYDMDDLYKTTTGVVEAMELVLDRAMQYWRLAVKESDKLDQDELWVNYIDGNGNVRAEPNKWVQWDQALRSEIFEMAARMQGLNIDERRAKIQEAQTEILGRALQAAAAAIGLQPEQQKALGGALREQLTLITSEPQQPFTPKGEPATIEGREAA
jgi:hypothetical protein